jgi:hypothetical protein
MSSVRYFCLILAKFEFFRQIFMKVTNTKFHGNPSVGSRSDTCGQKDGLTTSLIPFQWNREFMSARLSDDLQLTRRLAYTAHGGQEVDCLGLT